MVYIDNYHWFVGITILSLIMYSLGVTLEGISRSTAMSLIILKYYQEQVAIHKESANETHRLQFIDKWESIVGNRVIATEIFIHVERDWMYTLYLANRSDNVLMDLIVNLNVKMTASQQLVSYLGCHEYYTAVPIGTRLIDFQNVAAHLLAFCTEGIDELLQSLNAVLDSLLSADELNVIKIFGEELKKTEACDSIRIILHTPEQIVRLNDFEIQEIETEIQTVLNDIKGEINSDINQEERLQFKLMFGMLDESVRDEGLVGSLCDMDQMKIFWAKSGDINKYLTKQVFKSANEEEYTIVDIIRTNLIAKAELNHVYRRNIVEKFECMIPNNFQIVVCGNQITNNANMKYNYH